jgi:hypothetical protein
MSFNQQKLAKVINQASGIFDTFIYKTDDTLAGVAAAGYFSASRFADTGSTPDAGWDGAKLEIKTSDGYCEGFVDGSTGTFTVSLSS